ncbi:hypothetical protein [Saccharomonospora piscinae]|uniref:hypothetical protein n=1 Tax=Saccharomonospora piscinae TaxID=687388 RepID=UPI0004671458|nr:hypothetical protein [Saccharomonospora piscinae]
MTSRADGSDIAEARRTGDCADWGEADTSVDPVADAAAVDEVLGRLIAGGYKFIHPRDPQGEIITIVGIRVHGTVIDVVRLDAEDEVTAMRLPEGEADVLSPGTVLWRRDGAMREVVDALLDLPDSAHRPASRSSGKGCWVSGNRGQARWLRAPT